MKNWSFSETDGGQLEACYQDKTGAKALGPPHPELCLRASQSQVVLCLTLIMSTTNRAPARHLVSTNM